MLWTNKFLLDLSLAKFFATCRNNVSNTGPRAVMIRYVLKVYLANKATPVVRSQNIVWIINSQSVMRCWHSFVKGSEW